ncbi:hypothetical protein [Okeania sp. SIO2G5]|nr:hypothetical protein [Okeania sp. SIO2G5]
MIIVLDSTLNILPRSGLKQIPSQRSPHSTPVGVSPTSPSISGAT